MANDLSIGVRFVRAPVRCLRVRHFCGRSGVSDAAILFQWSRFGPGVFRFRLVFIYLSGAGGLVLAPVPL